MSEKEKTVIRRVCRVSVVFVSVVALILLATSGGTVVAQSSVDCSTVNYNGDGTSSNPYEVSSADELRCVGDDHANASDVGDSLESDYVLVSDVDVSGSTFEPVANFNNPFNGTFDGDGYGVTGLTVDRQNSFDSGLFGVVGEEGRVENVTVEDVDVSGMTWAGGLVGTNKGTVTNSHATGEVSATDGAGVLVGLNPGTVEDSYATGEASAVNISGGLVGRNEGEVARSYAEGRAEGGYLVGGLVGSNEEVITESYADTTVSGTRSDSFDLGGLVGTNFGEVNESYARGDVGGGRFAGGLVGSSDGTIEESYATGEVSGTDSGGLVGDLNFRSSASVVRDSYWDEDNTTKSDLAGRLNDNPTVENSEGLTTDEMKGRSAKGNMSGFDFSGTWLTGRYPFLLWEIEGEPPSYELSDLRPVDGTFTVGNSTVNVSVSVANVGGSDGNQDIALEVSNSTGVQYNDTVSGVTLSTGEVTTRNFTEVPVGNLSTGDYTHTVSSENDTVSGNITVQPKSTGPSVDDYRDDPNDPNSAVSLSGLQDAIDDFIAGNNNTDLSLLQDVINEFIAT